MLFNKLNTNIFLSLISYKMSIETSFNTSDISDISLISTIKNSLRILQFNYYLLVYPYSL